jgi:hypothetical protein
VRPGTFLVVAGVVVLALAALVSSLSGRDGAPAAAPEPEPPPATTAPEPNVIVTVPEDDIPAPPPEGFVLALGGTGAAGLFTYSDLDRGCRLVSLRLPTLREAAAPPDHVCEFDLTDDGRVGPAGAVWQHPDGGLAARCRDGTVHVFASGQPVYALAGCAPAWRPDGTLTLARGDGVVAYRLPCAQRVHCTTSLLPPETLAEAVRRHPNGPGRPADRLGAVFVQDLVWLTQTRAVALVDFRLRGRSALQQVVAVFDGARVVSVRPRDVSLAHLELSPRRRYVAAPPDLLLRADGAVFRIPARLRDVHAVAWSPDERWIAYATETTIALYRIEDDGTQTSVLPYPARAGDLDWR